MSDYLPRNDNELRNWATTFATAVAASPTSYGLSAADATTITNAVNLYTASLALVVDPATNSEAAYIDKEAKKEALCGTLRFYAQFIKHNNGVTNEEKVSLGLHIDDGTRTPTPAPTTPPVCTVSVPAPFQHELRLVDSASPTRRAKPRGVIGAEVWRVVVPAGTTPPPSPDADAAVRYCGLAAHSSHTLTLDPAELGKTVTYYVRWITRGGLRGPWGDPASKMVSA